MLDSAKKHGVSKRDAVFVMNNALARRVLREDTPKILYVGFDSKGRAREIITDLSHTTGKPVIFHAAALTPALQEFLDETRTAVLHAKNGLSLLMVSIEDPGTILSGS